MKHIIKQNGSVESYDPDKLQKSIMRTLKSCKIKNELAQKQAKQITDDFSIWLNQKSEVTSLDIRNKITYLLKKYSTSAASLYKNHKELW